MCTNLKSFLFTISNGEIDIRTRKKAAAVCFILEAGEEVKSEEECRVLDHARRRVDAYSSLISISQYKCNKQDWKK